VPKVKGTKMTITCLGPVFIGLKMGFPILLNYYRLKKHGSRKTYLTTDFFSLAPNYRTYFPLIGH
jgi:hypothetical protein